jgi:cell division protein FtsI (penicillin-binding protein 3)
MAEEHASSKFRLPWGLPSQRVARRESVQAPFEWRATVRSRMLVCAAVFALWTVGIEARLVYLQVIARAELQARADKQQLMTMTAPFKRGAITDANGRLLAFSVDAFTVAADPQHVEDGPKTVRLVCEAVRCDVRRRLELEKEIVDLAAAGRAYIVIQREVSPDLADRVRALDLNGVGLYPESKRYYPNKSLAAHVLGYVGRDNVGLAGLEATYDLIIRGKEGRFLLQVDSRRKAMAVREAVPATAGDSLELTIDQYLQRIAERELEAGVKEHNAASGTVVVMNPQTGAILALANYPTFNPNVYGAFSAEDRKNRVTQDVYEPGSTFKLVTASAALEERVVGVSDMIDCAPGWIRIAGRAKPINDVHAYGLLSFEDVIVKSSNVGAIKAGMRIGAERLSLYVNRFGFGQVLSPDFRGQTAGIWRPSDLNESGLASVSMGYQIGVTPLQMAAAVSSVANGGTLYEPRLLRAIIRNGQREPVSPKALRRTVSPETAATLTGIMEAVVERGTATAAKIDGFTVAGKTGTAARIVDGAYSKSEYHTSFVGFAPSRQPALTVIVVIDSPHGKVTAYGGTVAAPIFKRIAEASLRHLGIGATVNSPSPVLSVRADSGVALPQPSLVGVAGLRNERIQTAQDGVMPDLLGLSSREAVGTVTRLGLAPRTSGTGFVIEQSPEPGVPLVAGEIAMLKLARTAPKAPASSTQASPPRGGTQ